MYCILARIIIDKSMIDKVTSVKLDLLANFFTNKAYHKLFRISCA